VFFACFGGCGLMNRHQPEIDPLGTGQVSFHYVSENLLEKNLILPGGSTFFRGLFQVARLSLTLGRNGMLMKQRRGMAG
jgi:hypothetical protein